MSDATVSGACLCGGVRFHVGLPSLFCAHCHCTMCRRNHGAAYVTWFGVPRERFGLDAGEDLLRRYESSSHATRTFCGRCGTSLFFESQRNPDRVEIPLANMEGELDRRPEVHVFFDDHVAWLAADDGLPRLGGDTGMEPIRRD